VTDAATPVAANEPRAPRIPREAPSALPAKYSPAAAVYAPGPFLEPELVEPSAWKWRDIRTLEITTSDGTVWRALRVFSEREFIGYWGIEQVGGQDE
jgi:hypothetical protein